MPSSFRDRVLAELTDRAWLQAMLDAERALAVAEAAVGTIPSDAAAAIAAVCERRALRPGAHRDRGTARREPGRAARARVAPARRRRAGRVRALRGDEPGHRRHGRDAGLGARARARARGRGRGRSSVRDTRPRAPGHADGRAHAPAAGPADDLRAEGRGLARRCHRVEAPGRRGTRTPGRAARRGRGHPRVAGRGRPAGARGHGARARAGRAHAAVAHDARTGRRARRGAGRPVGIAREDRTRHRPAGADRGRRGRRAARAWPGRLVDAAAQAQSGRVDAHAGMRSSRARLRGPAHGCARAGARARAPAPGTPSGTVLPVRSRRPRGRQARCTASSRGSWSGRSRCARTWISPAA